VKGCRLAPPVARARERPRSRRAAEQCDELAPLHSITSSARASRVGGTATLASIVAKAHPGIRFNEHVEGDGPTVFAHACKLGLEGIVSKRKDSAYRSGRSPDWLKMKNPDAPAVTREAEEDWTR
jgi:hypothetical protein